MMYKMYLALRDFALSHGDDRFAIFPFSSELLGQTKGDQSYKRYSFWFSGYLNDHNTASL